MTETKYGLVKLDRNDQMFRLPEHFNKNSDAIIKQLDEINEKIGVMQRDIEYLRTLYYGGDR